MNRFFKKIFCNDLIKYEERIIELSNTIKEIKDKEFVKCSNYEDELNESSDKIVNMSKEMTDMQNKIDTLIEEKDKLLTENNIMKNKLSLIDNRKRVSDKKRQKNMYQKILSKGPEFATWGRYGGEKKLQENIERLDKEIEKITKEIKKSEEYLKYDMKVKTFYVKK